MIEKKIKLFVITLLTLGAIFLISESFNKIGVKHFQGKGEGFAGDILVNVGIKNNKILSIDILKSSETPTISNVAFRKLTDNIISNQSLDIDNIAGATYTSTGFKEAISAAVSASGVTLSAVVSQRDALVIHDAKTDIVVIGGGGAGLAAAIEATERGAKVILVEKMPILGGNTTYATGGLNATGTPQQNNNGDTTEIFFNDTMSGGGNLNNPNLVKTMVENSKDAVAWLTNRGANLSDVGRMGGSSFDRTHRPTGGDKVGPNLIDNLKKRATELNIDIRTMTKAIEFIVHNGEFAGIIVEHNGQKYSINSKAIIIATGGFGNNEDIFSKFNPKLKGFVSTNHPGATGDVLTMLEPYNVELVDIDQIQTHPTVVPSNSTMITEAVRGNGAILINRDGNRFTNEIGTRDIVSKDILSQKGQTAFLFFDTGVRNSLKAIESYIGMGITTQGATMEELADKLDINSKTLQSTIDTYNKGVNENSDIFGRTSLPRTLSIGPFFAVEVAPGVHHTMGGIKIDEKTRVYRKDGAIISGVFGAGEVTGGVHGNNRLGGNALTDIIVFGRIAGEEAVKYVQNK